MASSVKIKLNSRGMAATLKDSGVRSMLTERAERVLAAAQADPHDDLGDYESGLHIEQDTTDRAVVRVVSGDFKGHILEARYGILARALDAAGGS
jgi:transposase-like protein